MPMLDEQPVQFAQRLDRHPWWAKQHGGALQRIKHPPGHGENYAGCDLNVYQLACCPALAVLAPESPAVQGMPAVEDLNFLPEMGRMNGRWRWGDRTGCSPAPCGLANAPPPS